MHKKLYSSTEQELVYDWSEKWFELCNLINGLIWTDDPPWTTPPPTDSEEMQYQSLRFWFIDHQEQFIPIWADYYNCKSRVCTEDFTIENVEELLDTDEYIKNSFNLFYRASNLHRFAQQLELQSGVDIWEPSHNYASKMEYESPFREDTWLNPLSA